MRCGGIGIPASKLPAAIAPGDKAYRDRQWAEGRAKEAAAHLAFLPPHGAAEGYLLAYLHYARAETIEAELTPPIPRRSTQPHRLMVRIDAWLRERRKAGERKAINVNVHISTRDLPKPREPGSFMVVLMGGGKRKQAIVNEAMGDNEFGSVMASILEGLRPPLEGSYLPDEQIDRGMPLNTVNHLAGAEEDPDHAGKGFAFEGEER